MSTAVATDWAPAGAWTEVVTVRVEDAGAEVIDLDAHRAVRRPTARTYRRRRVGVVAVVAAIATLLVLLLGGSADAGLEDPIAGSTVLAPGETLWEVASVHAPAGVTTAEYLDSIRDLNEFSGAPLPAWTVVLLPHH